jgi:hypothetical protein
VDGGADLRTAKHLFATRPIFHKLDETIRCHVFCTFLALVLKKVLEDRIAALGRSSSGPEIIADLDSLIETEIAGRQALHRSLRPTSRCQPRPIPLASRCHRPCAKPPAEPTDPPVTKT